MQKLSKKIVRWRKNIFDVPTYAVGRRFVKLLLTLLSHFNNQTKYGAIAMKTFLILPALLLQKPSRASKLSEHKQLLTKRLNKLEEGDVTEDADRRRKQGSTY